MTNANALVDVSVFVDAYAPADQSRIAFHSNGERGAALRDANAGFRGEVCRALRAGRPASDDLVRDLYDAESQWSAAAWCVRHEMIAFLAGELLRRGGAENIRHYLECIRRSQDCYFSSLCVRLSREQRTAALAQMADLLAAEDEAEESAGRRREVMERLARSDAESDA